MFRCKKYYNITYLSFHRITLAEVNESRQSIILSDEVVKIKFPLLPLARYLLSGNRYLPRGSKENIFFIATCTKVSKSASELPFTICSVKEPSKQLNILADLVFRSIFEGPI